MPAHAVPIDVKEKGVMWLLPPYSWSVRHIAQKLALSSSVVAKWRLELVAQGLLPKNERISSVDGD
ncbi:helix-turn-helix domain-containing protein, partial [Salmonella enterica]|nr:helix-turn-helix domain-containing protein [Salmonella enterica]